MKTCDQCGTGMLEGYCLGGGSFYYCGDACLIIAQGPTAWDDWEIGEDESDSYYTTWEDEEDD